MAKCGHCNHVGTKLEEISPTGGRYKMMAICCTSCSAILGVTDYLNSGVLLKAVETKVDNLATAMNHINSAIERLKMLLRKN